jgi:hypothetical protein
VDHELPAKSRRVRSTISRTAAEWRRKIASSSSVDVAMAVNSAAVLAQTCASSKLCYK